MKKYLLLMLVVLTGIVSSCKYDDDELWGSVDDLANRVSALETLTKQMNGDIAALQAVITAVENRVSISEVEKLTDGYILHFTNGTSATIKHGKNGSDGKDGQMGADGTDGADGKDGADGADGEDGKDGQNGKDGKDAPYIYIAKDNGVYYWTITVDGKTDWLTDTAGNKIPVTGAVGADGSDGKDGADGSDGTAGSAGSNGTPGAAGAPGRTPTLKISDDGEWQWSYDGQTWTAVAGAANAIGQIGSPGALSIFEDVTATDGAVTIQMADGNEYTLLRLKNLEFYADSERTTAVSPKEMTWKADVSTFEYYFNLNLNDAKYEVMAEGGLDAVVDMEAKKVTLTLEGTTPAKAKAVILFYNKQQTLTSVFKFKHFEANPNGNIVAVNEVLEMLATTEELTVQIPALTTAGENANGGEVELPLIDGATQEGTGTNLTLNFTGNVTTSGNQPLVIKQHEEGTGTPEQSGTSIHNVTVNFVEPVNNLDLRTPNSSVTLTGGQKLDDVTALTGESTLYVDSVEINVLKVKGGSVHIFPEGYIKGNIKNESGKTITIYLEPGATVEKNLPNGFDAEKGNFEIVYLSHKIVIKNKEFAYALSCEYPENVTLGKNGYAEFTPEWANGITFMNFSYKGYTISSLEGIEHFQNLKELIFAGVGLTTCNLSRNVNLERVVLSDNNLQSLDFSQNQKLYDLDCTFNKNLKSLDISNCTKLTRLKVSETALTSVSIYNKAQITTLHYGYTNLSFDLSQFPALTSLGCYGHNFHSLNLSAKQKQQMEELQCYYSEVNELDLSEYPNLTLLNAHYNNLKTLNVAAAPKLNYLNCHNNRIDSLDISTLYNLEYLYCGEQHLDNPMTLSLTESQQTKWNDEWTLPDFAYGLNDNVTLKIVEEDNRIVVIENVGLSAALYDLLGSDKVSLNADNYAEMKMKDVLKTTELDFGWNNDGKNVVTSLNGIEHFKNLQVLSLNNTGLKECDLSQNKALRYVMLCNVECETLDFSNLTELTDLACAHSTVLKKIILDGCEKLTHLECQNTSIAELNIPKPEIMNNLIYGGKVGLTVDYDKFTSLTALGIQHAGLTELVLPDFLKQQLNTLWLNNENHLTSLNLEEFPNLNYLSCDDNDLTSLDISKAPKLQYLSCTNNYIPSLDISQRNLINLNCGNQKNRINMVLTLTDDQKTLWNEEWSKDWGNERVYFEGEEPAQIEGGTSSGQDFGNGGNF